MPLTIFDHDALACYQSVPDPLGPHQFGGDPSDAGIAFRRIRREVHLVALLDNTDPSVSFVPNGLQRLPLCYGFRFVSNGEDFSYFANSESEVEVLPDALTEGFVETLTWGSFYLLLRLIGLMKIDHGHQYDASFPYEGHPNVFPQSKFRFDRQPYDPAIAEDALRLQGIFGLGHLSDAELQRAAEIGVSNAGYVSDPDRYDCSNLEKVQRYGRSPFYQTRPSAWCNNPKCESDDYKRTLKVIAIYVADDELIWGGSGPQMIFALCERCGCIIVSNQA